MTRAPYSRDTIERIGQGATARDLGWDNAYYRFICGVEKLTPVVPAAPALAPPSPAAIADVLQQIPAPLKTAASDCTYDAVSMEVSRGDVTVALPRRQADMFAILAKSPLHEHVSGRIISERMGVPMDRLGNFVQALRGNLRRLNMIVAGHKGPQGGYRIADLNTLDPVKVVIVNPKNGR